MTMLSLSEFVGLFDMRDSDTINYVRSWGVRAR
jgi:hypothetical protein